MKVYLEFTGSVPVEIEGAHPDECPEVFATACEQAFERLRPKQFAECASYAGYQVPR